MDRKGGDSDQVMELIRTMQHELAVLKRRAGGTLGPGGFFVLNVVSIITSQVILDSWGMILFDAKGITATLPTAVGRIGRVFIVKRRVGPGAPHPTLATTGVETIDGSALPVVFNLQYQTLTMVSDGVNWLVI